MNCHLGVMQGRLLPKYKSRYQAHPVGYWQQEFPLAAKLNLDCIEFILDYDGWQNNPLMTQDGLNEINKIISQTGVSVRSICADYFMDMPLHSLDKDKILQGQNILKHLIIGGSMIGVRDIVIPFVDHSSFNHNRVAMERFMENIEDIVLLAEDQGVNLALETDLSPVDFLWLIEQIGSNFVTVNYDIGNSAALGYDVNEEIRLYGHKISDIHIKDRKYRGGSVELGSGDASFHEFFSALSKTSFEGVFIMQAYRDNDGIRVFKKQLDWIKPYMGYWIGDKK